MKKTFGIFLALVVVCISTFALADIAINNTNFPDSIFNSYVQQFDTDSNGWLSDEEIDAVDEISCSGGISSLKGIEYFTKLKKLNCSDNTLTSLDINHNNLLECLDCHGNNLRTLDVSKCTKLEQLFCYDNNIYDLDISKCIQLCILIGKYECRVDGDKCDWMSDMVTDLTTRIEADRYFFESGKPGVYTDDGAYMRDITTKVAVFVQPKKKTAKSLIIKDTVKILGKNYKVTVIRDNACEGMKKLTAVTFGKNIRKIGYEAFLNCKKLKTLRFTSKILRSVGEGAFKGIYKKPVVYCQKKLIEKYKTLLQKGNLPINAVFRPN